MNWATELCRGGDDPLPDLPRLRRLDGELRLLVGRWRMLAQDIEDTAPYLSCAIRTWCDGADRFRFRELRGGRHG